MIVILFYALSVYLYAPKTLRLRQIVSFFRLARRLSILL